MGYGLTRNKKKLIVRRTKVRPALDAHHIEEVLSSGCWSGERCFLLGGGPSLVNFDFSKLDGELTIGVNKTFNDYYCTVNYSMDIGFYDYITNPSPHPPHKALCKRWEEYPGIKAILVPDRPFRFKDNSYVVPKVAKECINLEVMDGIFPGNNSGFGALMLALQFGANPIYLLGYDFKTTKTKTHYHEGYEHYRKQDTDSLQPVLDKFRRQFERLEPTFRSLDVSIINLNRESALECFPKGRIENLLKG